MTDIAHAGWELKRERRVFRCVPHGPLSSRNGRRGRKGLGDEHSTLNIHRPIFNRGGLSGLIRPNPTKKICENRSREPESRSQKVQAAPATNFKFQKRPMKMQKLDRIGLNWTMGSGVLAYGHQIRAKAVRQPSIPIDSQPFPAFLDQKKLQRAGKNSD